MGYKHIGVRVVTKDLETKEERKPTQRKKYLISLYLTNKPSEN